MYDASIYHMSRPPIVLAEPIPSVEVCVPCSQSLARHLLFQPLQPHLEGPGARASLAGFMLRMWATVEKQRGVQGALERNQ